MRKRGVRFTSRKQNRLLRERERESRATNSARERESCIASVKGMRTRDPGSDRADPRTSTVSQA